jgi:CDP-glycerol glycerophosphotransferase
VDIWHVLSNRRVKWTLRTLISLARTVVPARHHAVLYCWPQEEGNGVELVDHLGSLGVRLWWLIDDPSSSAVQELVRKHPSVRARKRLSPSGFFTFLTARVTFFTHGIYLSGASPRRKTVVNLWHGDGPKRNFMPNHEPPPRCHYVVSCSTVFGRSKAEFFELPESNLLVTGNPRNDALFRPVPSAKLRALGVQADKYVVYMPTYRSARNLGATVAWQEGETQTDPRLESLTHLIEATTALGLTLVIKPHPLDSIGMDAPGAVTISDADLGAARLNTYELLAASHSLVTDYSSIWTDYLSTGKHVGFAVPDWEEYADSRGIESVSREALPGPVLRSTEEALAFFRAIEDNDPALVGKRDAAITAFGLVTEDGNCRRLLEALEARGVHLPIGTS